MGCGVGSGREGEPVAQGYRASVKEEEKVLEMGVAGGLQNHGNTLSATELYA